LIFEGFSSRGVGNATSPDFSAMNAVEQG